MGRQLLQAVADSLAQVGVLLSALADEGGDQVERRLADPALDVDHPKRRHRDQSHAVGRARMGGQRAALGAQGDIGQTDDHVPAVVEQQLPGVANQLGDRSLGILGQPLAELDVPLDLREATLEVRAKVFGDSAGPLDQLRLGVETHPKRPCLCLRPCGGGRVGHYQRLSASAAGSFKVRITIGQGRTPFQPLRRGAVEL